jgi:hypothetical protein
MRINSLLRIFAVLAVFVVVFGSAFAQEDQKKESRYPADQFGVGAVMTMVNLRSPLLGGQLSYAFDETFHAGAQVAFAYQSENTVDKIESATYFYFAPYLKYFFSPIRTFKPFAKASFVISSIPEKDWDQAAGKYRMNEATNTNIEVSLGGEWLPFKSVGVFGGLQFFEYQLDRKTFLVGTGPAFVGLEWFF